MSVQAMAWVMDHSEATGTDRLVLLIVANYADEYGNNAWPSQSTIAAKAKMSTRQVQRILSNLVENGHLTRRVHAGGTHRTQERYRPNLYALNMSTGTSGTSGLRDVTDVTPDALRDDTQGPEGRHTGSSGSSRVSSKPSFIHPRTTRGGSRKPEDATAAAMIQRVNLTAARAAGDVCDDCEGSGFILDEDNTAVMCWCAAGGHGPTGSDGRQG